MRASSGLTSSSSSSSSSSSEGAGSGAGSGSGSGSGVGSRVAPGTLIGSSVNGPGPGSTTPLLINSACCRFALSSSSCCRFALSSASLLFRSAIRSARLLFGGGNLGLPTTCCP